MVVQTKLNTGFSLLFLQSIGKEFLHYYFCRKKQSLHLFLLPNIHAEYDELKRITNYQLALFLIFLYKEKIQRKLRLPLCFYLSSLSSETYDEEQDVSKEKESAYRCSVWSTFQTVISMNNDRKHSSPRYVTPVGSWPTVSWRNEDSEHNSTEKRERHQISQPCPQEAHTHGPLRRILLHSPILRTVS